MADTRKLPDAIVVIDMKKEALAVREARRLNIPVIGLVDTNCDPDDADFVIPGNDDAIRSSALIVRLLADAIAEGRNRGVKVSDFVSENGDEAEPARRGRRAAAEPARRGGAGAGRGAGRARGRPAAEAEPAAAEAADEPAPARARRERLQAHRRRGQAAARGDPGAG